MDETWNFNSMTITTINGDRNQIEFVLLHTEGDVKESVSLLVSVPLGQSRTVLEFQKAASERAIELLQNMWSFEHQPQKTS